MSRLTTTLMNAVPRLVIAGPIHRLMSGRCLTLHMTGRRTGRRYHLPVAYRDTLDASVEALRALVTIPGYPKAAGIRRIGGTVAEADLRRAAHDRVTLAIEIGEPT
ncbi:MAG: hypothetical protein ACK5PP_11145 [Acidimicrobiales bacterium]